MNQRPTPFDGLRIDRLERDIPEFSEECPRPFRGTDAGAGVEGWTFSQFLSALEKNQYKYEEKRWLKLDGNEIIGFESEGRKMFLGIAEIVISFHDRKMFSGNLVRRIRILPDLNVIHESPPLQDAFEDGGQRSDIDHFRWMVAALVQRIISRYPHKISSKFLLFFSEIFTVQEGLKSYYVSQLYHPIFFNSSDRCNLIRMMRDQYNLNPHIFKEHFELESYGFKDWWLKIGNGRYGDAFHGVLKYKSNFKSLYNKSNGFALPLYIRNVHEHFFQKGRFYHENIDSAIDNRFPGVSAAIIDSAIRNLHGYWGLFGSNTPTLPYLQRNSPYGWCFPDYRLVVMGCRGDVGCQWMFNADKSELREGPYYRRSVPFSQINATYTAEDPIILVKRNNVPKGSFTFDFKEEGVISPCTNHGQRLDVVTLEVVNNETDGDSIFCKVNKEFYPCLYQIIQGKTKWGDDFKFRGLATFQPGLMEWTLLILEKHKDVLCQANIYGAVGVSCYPFDRDQNVWRAFCELWSPLTNTLHHAMGEFSLSLYDLKIIGGLPALGVPYDEFIPTNESLIGGHDYYPTMVEVLRIHANLCTLLGDSKVSWSQWVYYFYRGEIIHAGFGENSTFPYKKQVRSSMHAFPLKVSNKGELVAFLALWLSRFVLPYGNDVVRPETFYMASLMAEGVRISLAPAVLGYIYHGLNQIALNSKGPGMANPNFPAHYVLGWLGEYIPILYCRRVAHEFPEEYPVLVRYAGAKAKDFSLAQARIIFRSSSSIYERPFSFDKNREGIEVMDFASTPDEHFEFLVYIRSGLLPVRVGQELWLEPYYPNRFARQLGFDQGVPANVFFSNFSERGAGSIEQVARAQRMLLRRGTGTRFFIPGMYHVGECSFWYCRYWVKCSAPYLGLSVRHVHKLTGQSYRHRETVSVIERIRTDTSDIRRSIHISEIDSNPTMSNKNAHLMCKSKVSIGRQRSPSDDDVNFKRARYKRPEGSNGTDSGEATHASYHDLSFSDVNDTSHEIDSLAPSGVTCTPHETDPRVPIIVSEDENLTEDLVDYGSPSNLAKEDSTIVSIENPNSMIPELQQLSLLIEHADNVPDRLTGQFILDTINQISSCFTVSNTFSDVLHHRDLIKKSLSRLQGIVSGDDFGKATVDWFSEFIHRVLSMAAAMELEDKSLKEDPKIDPIRLIELTEAHEDVLTKQRSLNCTLNELNEKSGELKSRESELLEAEAKIRERADLEIKQKELGGEVEKVQSLLSAQANLDKELCQQMIATGKNELDRFTSHGTELGELISTISSFYKA